MDELQAAQARLEEKRATLKVTENRGQQIGNINEPLQAVIERCREKAAESGGQFYVVSEEREYGQHKPEESWFGKYSGIARLYKDYSFENFTGNDALITDLKELAESDNSVVLRGATGCGKTHLAVSMLRHNQNHRFMFISVPDLLLKIRSTFNQGTNEEDIIEEYASYPLLVLDDMGAEKTSEFAIERLYIILDRRQRACLKTIITTNLPQTAIEETFGARIASRMAAMENIKINMPDHRKRRK